jgi:uncharacterized protein
MPGSGFPILRHMADPSTRLRLRVSPGASRSELVGRQGDSWKVRVKAPAERGRANKAALALIAEAVMLPRDRISVVGGASGRDKLLRLDGVASEDVESRLESSLRRSRG